MNSYVEGSSILCLPYYSKVTYCLKVFDNYFWQNIWAANLQYKLTNAKQFVSPNFQELRIVPENNLPKLARMAMHIRKGHGIAFQLEVLEFCLCDSFVVPIQYASLPFPLTISHHKFLRFLAIKRRWVF